MTGQFLEISHHFWARIEDHIILYSDHSQMSMTTSRDQWRNEAKCRLPPPPGRQFVCRPLSLSRTACQFFEQIFKIAGSAGPVVTPQHVIRVTVTADSLRPFSSEVIDQVISSALSPDCMHPVSGGSINCTVRQRSSGNMLAALNPMIGW